jgi:hypothetical protein
LKKKNKLERKVRKMVDNEMQNQPFIDKNKDKGSDNLWEVENGSHSINEESKLVNKFG